jgi:hypothetical protein
MARRRVALHGACCVLLAVLAACGGGGSKASTSKSSSSKSSSTSKRSESSDSSSDEEAGSVFHGDGYSVVIPPALSREDTTTKDGVRFHTGDSHAILEIVGPRQLDTKADLAKTALGALDGAKAHDISEPASTTIDGEPAVVRHGIVSSSGAELKVTVTAVEHAGNLYATIATVVASEADNAEMLDRTAATLTFDDSSSSSSDDTATSAATVMRDRLLVLAEDPASIRPQQPNVFSVDPDITTWAEEFPSFTFKGSSLEATTNAVSGRAIQTSTVKSVEFLSFAVIDADGHCAGGIVEYNSDHTQVTTSLKVDDPPECRANTVAEISGY